MALTERQRIRKSADVKNIRLSAFAVSWILDTIRLAFDHYCGYVNFSVIRGHDGIPRTNVYIL